MLLATATASSVLTENDVCGHIYHLLLITSGKVKQKKSDNMNTYSG